MRPNPRRIALNRSFAQDEWRRVCRGFIPRDCDDKWVLLVEQDTICIHRSWSGMCVFQVPVRLEGDEWRTEALLVSPRSEASADHDAWDLELASGLISRLLQPTSPED